MSDTHTHTDHRSTVLELYAAFGRGDLDGMAATIADSVDWGLDPRDPVVKAVPWLANVRTKDEVFAGYFFHVGNDLDVTAFEPYAIAVDGDNVVTALRIAFTVKATGKSIDVLESHWFTLGADGRIVKYRPILDTQAFVEAFTP